MPILNGSSQALWQSKTAPDVQGRVFSVRRMIAQFTQPFAIILAGPLIDRFFQPLMDDGGRLTDNIGQIIGSGPGRGTGLLFILLGILTITVSLAAYAYPRLRRVEDELADYIEDETDKNEESDTNLDIDIEIASTFEPATLD